MTKGLEALEKLIGNKVFVSLGRTQGKKQFANDINIIEKELKALDIVKEKKVDVDILYQSVDYRVYNEKTRHCFYKKPLTLEEWCLLKEMFL